MAGRCPVPLVVVTLHGRTLRDSLSSAWPLRYRRSSELQAALATTGHAHGIVVVAGTGAQVYLRTADRRIARLDGLGPMLGDTGSGYYIGREALRAVAREIQLGLRPTRLRRRVLRECKCRSLGELIRFSLLPRDRSLVASLAKIVDEEARAGNALARCLLRAAARRMADTVRELVDHVGLDGKAFPLVGAGSVIVRSDIYWREFRRQVRRFAPRFACQRIGVPPVAGLAAVGLRRPDAIRKLFATLKKES